MSHAHLSAVIGEKLDDLAFDDEQGELENGSRMKLYLARDPSAIANEIEDEVEGEDLDFLCDQAGLIVTELADGTTYVRYFDNEDKLENHWADLCGGLEDEEGDRADDETDEEE